MEDISQGDQMLRSKCLVTLLLTLMAVSNFVDAANQTYVVSFIADQSQIGLLTVTQTDTEIQAGKASITPIDKTLGSTALFSFRNAWDGDIYFEVFATFARGAAKPIQIGEFQFNSQLKQTGYQNVLTIFPGHYHPLHLFQIGTGISLFATGPYGTSGANNYVAYTNVHSNNPAPKRNIFGNPANRFPGSAAISPDGGLASQMTFSGSNHEGWNRKLNNGNLDGSPTEWLNVNNFQGYSQSLSNPIQSTNRTTAPKAGTRYLAYRNFRQGTPVNQSQILIQNVDATTGQPQGRARAITNFAKALNVDAEKFQSIALSPNGSLILYTVWNDECKKQILVARNLVNGSSSGKAKAIVGCKQLETYSLGVYGINIAPVVP
jgi:hypothetical protein